MSPDSPLRTLKITLAYDGTGFVGWQRQPAGVSVQGVVEGALSRLDSRPVALAGAGRTDAGVHALGQVASARVSTALETATIARALNAMLPPEVRVLTVEDADPDFHARFGVRSKTYQYRIHAGEILSPFDRLWCWHVPRPLDIPAMQEASAALVGSHDFAVFQSTGGSVKTTIRTIIRAEWRAHGPDGRPAAVTIATMTQEARGETITFEIEADGFLRHMVRSIVGTLLEVGDRRRPATSIAELLATGRRALAGPTAPARGLFLVRVDYP